MVTPDLEILVLDSTLLRMMYSKPNGRTAVMQQMDCYTCWLNVSFKGIEFNLS